MSAEQSSSARDWPAEVAVLATSLRTSQRERTDAAAKDLDERRASAQALIDVARSVLNAAIEAAGKDLTGERSEDETGLHFRLAWKSSPPERGLRISIHPNSGFFSWQYL